MRTILAAVALTLLWAGTQVTAQTKMSVGVGIDPSMSVLYVAEGAGIFKKNGLAVELKLGSSGSAMFPLVIGNQLQSAVGSEFAAIQTHNLNENVVVVAEVTRMPVWAGIVARDLNTLDDLKGKKIGVQRGSGSELTWVAIVKAKNLNIADYRIVAVDPPEMVAALERRDIDAFVAFEPWMTRATMNVPNTKWIVDNQGILDPRNFAIMNKEWLQQNMEAATNFVRSLVEAGDFIVANPDKASSIVAERLKLELPLTSALVQKLRFEVRLSDDTLKHLKTVEDQIASSGKLAKRVDWSKMLYAAPLRAARPDRVDASVP